MKEEEEGRIGIYCKCNRFSVPGTQYVKLIIELIIDLVTVDGFCASFSKGTP